MKHWTKMKWKCWCQIKLTDRWQVYIWIIVIALSVILFSISCSQRWMWSLQNFYSPKMKTQVSFPDRNFSAFCRRRCCRCHRKLFTFLSSSSPETMCQFKLNCAQSMEGNCRQRSMYLAFILTFFIINARLYVYMHVSCFHSYSSLFFILVCMLTRVYHVMDFLHTLIPVLFEFLSYSLLLF